MITTLRESKAKLSALVERAARGEEVVITVRGKPKARLCHIAAAGPHERRDSGKWRKELREARAAYSTGRHDTTTEIIDDIRGDRS
jgi:prevent-host-death family protein